MAANDTPKQKRKAPGPKAFYLVYTIEDGELNDISFSRKTDEVLSAMSDNEGAKVKKLMAAPGR